MNFSFSMVSRQRLRAFSCSLSWEMRAQCWNLSLIKYRCIFNYTSLLTPFSSIFCSSTSTLSQNRWDFFTTQLLNCEVRITFDSSMQDLHRYRVSRRDWYLPRCFYQSASQTGYLKHLDTFIQILDGFLEFLAFDLLACLRG